ncbi:MAG: U32 family peptidase [Prevotellaceae bacterium]|nr:U32 family peptidase [Prevotellaceae bacterium]
MFFDNKVTKLELLAPAKNLEYGIAAIDHGADAVYIGAERFGARAAAGNSVADIKKLCDYAHVFKVKVYVTVNTILYDDELADTEKLIHELYEAGADAILVQDMGILKMNLPPIDLHASTQTDNRTVEKVRWLADQGFSRVVLARELTMRQIGAIYANVPDVELEAFVHGALCVSYSGQCYASQYCFKRSANRGECAQFCRLKFDLEDSDGKTIERGKYMLSLKDLSQYHALEDLVIAGVSSFKIEGRLKDLAYVKNVTAAYSEMLEIIIEENDGMFERSSLGTCNYKFKPDLNKTFNRGYCNYGFYGRCDDISSFDTPKAKGEYVGKVKEVRGNSFTVAGTTFFANGDGLCFMNGKHELEGFRVNKVENGNRIYPHKMPVGLRKGTELYRNNDQAFTKFLSKESAVRKIAIKLTLSEIEDGFRLEAEVWGVVTVSVDLNISKQIAMKSQKAIITQQLMKLGNTPFVCIEFCFNNHDDSEEDFKFFIQSCYLTEMKHAVIEKLTKALREQEYNTSNRSIRPLDEYVEGKNEYPSHAPYLYNVSNRLARQYYKEEGITVGPAFELETPKNPLIMQCKHCIRHALGYCTKYTKKPDWREPLYLKLPDGKRFRLQFDCKNCQMNIYADN